MKLSEAEICKDVETVCIDPTSQTLSVLSTAGILFDSHTPQKRIDLNTACTKLEAWSTVGRMNSRIVVAGINSSTKSIEYVLVNASSMKVINKVTVTKNVSHPAWHIRLLKVDSRLIVISSRWCQHVDVLQVVDDRLWTCGDSNTAIEVCGSGNYISSITPMTSSNNVLICGQHWMKRIDIR